MKKLNNKGFSVVEGLLILIIVGIIGGVGYFVYNQNNKTPSVSNSSIKKEKIKLDKNIKDLSGSYEISYPANWSAKAIDGKDCGPGPANCIVDGWIELTPANASDYTQDGKTLNKLEARAYSSSNFSTINKLLFGESSNAKELASINGHKSYQIDQSANDSGLVYKDRHYVVVGKDISVVFSFRYSQEKDANYLQKFNDNEKLPTIKEIVKSIKFINE